MLTLRMEFSTGEGKNFLVSVPQVKAGLTQTAVEAAMNSLVTANVFTTTLTGLVGAEVVDRTSVELF